MFNLKLDSDDPEEKQMLQQIAMMNNYMQISESNLIHPYDSEFKELQRKTAYEYNKYKYYKNLKSGKDMFAQDSNDSSHSDSTQTANENDT